MEYRVTATTRRTCSRIRFLQKVLEHSRVIDTNALPKDRVSPHEIDLEAGKISLKSPIGPCITTLAMQIAGGGDGTDKERRHIHSLALLDGLASQAINWIGRTFSSTGTA